MLIGRWEGQSHLSPSMQWSPPRALVSITLLKKLKLKIWPLAGRVLAVCISQLWWELVFGTKHARVGRHCLCCNPQIERALWVSSVSRLFPLILLLGAHSDKSSLSVLGFGAVLVAVVFHRKESANWRHMSVHGHFHRTWMLRWILHHLDGHLHPSKNQKCISMSMVQRTCQHI